MKRPYLIRAGDSLSQTFNTIVLNGEPDESTSARSYRRGVLEGSKPWKMLMRIIDLGFSPWESKHCRNAYYADIERMQRLVDTHSALVKHPTHC